MRERDGVCLYGLVAQDGCEGGLEVHHIVKRSQGGDDDIENGILLCNKHHDMATRNILKPVDFQMVLDRFYGD